MPDEPVEMAGEKQYQVISRNSFRLGKTEHGTGEKFTADFPVEQERFYIEGGLLKVVKTQQKKEE